MHSIMHIHNTFVPCFSFFTTVIRFVRLTKTWRGRIVVSTLSIQQPSCEATGNLFEKPLLTVEGNKCACDCHDAQSETTSSSEQGSTSPENSPRTPVQAPTRRQGLVETRLDHSSSRESTRPCQSQEASAWGGVTSASPLRATNANNGGVGIRCVR